MSIFVSIGYKPTHWSYQLTSHFRKISRKYNEWMKCLCGKNVTFGEFGAFWGHNQGFQKSKIPFLVKWIHNFVQNFRKSNE